MRGCRISERQLYILNHCTYSLISLKAKHTEVKNAGVECIEVRTGLFVVIIIRRCNWSALLRQTLWFRHVSLLVS